MKKLLLTAAMAFVGLSASFAQDWKAGDEITDKVQWGNLSFTSDDFNPWILESSKGSFTKTGGLFEVYDGADVDLYQFVELKAGMYHLECQAYYRFGNSWSEDPSQYGTDGWQDLAQLTVQNGTYNIDSQEFLGGRTFQAPIMPRLYLMYPSQIYKMPEGESSWDMSDGSYTVDGQTVWGPCSVPGSLMWFNAGLYAPNETGDTQYNRVSFFVSKDGYVKVGITKKEAKEADSFMATNFKLFYDGEISADYEFEILQDEVAEARNKAYAYSENFNEEYPALYSLMQDLIMETEGEEDTSTAESCKKYIDIYNQITLDYTAYYTQAQELTALIAKCEKILGTADDAEFKAAIEAAKTVEADGRDGGEISITEPTAYAKAAADLSAARDKFIKEFKNEDGSVDVTSYIKYPWFCLPEYEPTWDAENNCWIPNEAALNTVFSETANDDGTTTIAYYSDKDDTNGTINNLAKGVNINNNKASVGEWFQDGGGGNLEVYWNDKLTCVKKWSLVSENYHYVSQRLSGIPNGYYKLKALAQTWSNDWANNCENHIQIKSAAMESNSPFLTPGGWWGTDINQWLELETDMILVDDGEVLISSVDNGFAAFTGFRLYYFGETPDFNKLLAPQLAEINAANSVENGLWAGDVKAVDAILAKVPANIATTEEYATAMETINEAKDYISNAKSAISTFNGTTTDAFSALTTTYSEGDENEIATVAFMYALSVGEGENDTYLDAKAATEDAAMYSKYLDFVVNKAKIVDNADLAAAIEKQYASLKAEYANAETLAAYMEELAAPYNAGVIASLGNATPESPVDITTLIVNPKFEDGTKGYTGDMTRYSDPETNTTIVERWNTNSDISQTIYSLPAGTYELRVQAFYRDGGDAKTSFTNWIYNAAEEFEWWETKSAILYANAEETYVRSIASEKFTDQMTQYCNKMSDQGKYDENDNVILEPEYTLQPESDPNAYPWDTKVDDIDDEGADVSYYYPNSVQGSASVWMRHEDAYWNSVKVNLDQTGNITFGVKEGSDIGGDWVVMNQFKLFYLGYDPTAINTVNATAQNASEIYNVQGVRVSSLQKGLNIVRNGSSVKKIFVK